MPFHGRQAAKLRYACIDMDNELFGAKRKRRGDGRRMRLKLWARICIEIVRQRRCGGAAMRGELWVESARSRGGGARVFAARCGSIQRKNHAEIAVGEAFDSKLAAQRVEPQYAQC